MLKQIPIAILATFALIAGAASAAKPAPAPKEWTDALLTKALNAPYAKEFNAACVKALVDENCLFIKSAADYAAQKDNKRRGALSEMIMPSTRRAGRRPPQGNGVPQ